MAEERRVEQGQRLRGSISYRTINTMVELVRQQRLERLGRQGGEAGEHVPDAGLEVFVQNQTGTFQPPGSVLSILEGTPLDPVNDEAEFLARPCFTGTVPSSAADVVCVLRDGVAPGDLGLAIVVGLAVVTLDLTSTEHAFARPVEGDSSQMQSAAQGGHPVLWTATGDEGSQDAVVLLVPDTGDPVGFVRVTDEPDLHNQYPAVVETYDPLTFAWSTTGGEDCVAVPGSGRLGFTGEHLVIGTRYMAKYAGPNEDGADVWVTATSGSHTGLDSACLVPASLSIPDPEPPLPADYAALVTLIESLRPKLQTHFSTIDLTSGRTLVSWCIDDDVCDGPCPDQAGSGSGTGTGPPHTPCCDSSPTTLCVSFSFDGAIIPPEPECSGFPDLSTTATWSDAQGGYVVHLDSGGYVFSGVLRCEYWSTSKCPDLGASPGYHWGFTGTVRCPGFVNYVTEPCVYENQVLISEACGPTFSVQLRFASNLLVTFEDCGGAPPITTDCCPDPGLPSTVHLTVVDEGGCSCFAGTYPLTWDGSEWVYVSFGGICGATSFFANLSCTGGQWNATVSCRKGASTTFFFWTLAATCTLPLVLASTGGTYTGSLRCCTGNLSGSIGA